MGMILGVGVVVGAKFHEGARVGGAYIIDEDG
jgi:hypothetical protein